MARVVVLGAGVAGLCTAMLLARDGHEVTVLERDEGAPPDEPRAAWGAWERRGVNQFRLLHFFQPRFRQELEAELPDVPDRLEAAGALRINFVKEIPAEITGGYRDGDDQFTVLTGRRPVVESVLNRAAAERPGLEIRRGVAVTELLTGTPAAPGIPHVTGVRTEAGEDITADLVIDAGGRRSALPRLLAAIGARPVVEDADDCGFVYYGRHFHSADGSIPPMFGPPLGHYGSVSILTLPADNGTWGVGVVTTADDPELRGLRSVDKWEKTVKAFPLIAHWLDAEPLDSDVAVMAKIEDRIRKFVVDGQPVATGVVAVADAWACTNPSVGRGATLGFLHAIELRNHLRAGMDDPVGFVSGWAARTETALEPWYRETLHMDRHRLATAQAAARGETYESDDETWNTMCALEHGSGQDPELLRCTISIAGLLASRDEVLGRPGVRDKALAVGAGWRDAGWLGPSRAELVKLVND